jgi:hypothetical protein
VENRHGEPHSCNLLVLGVKAWKIDMLIRADKQPRRE